MLVLMYYLSQNPNFAESVKPLMGQLKNSEQMLRFLNDLSNFTQTFSTFQNAQPQKNEKADKKSDGNATDTSKQTENDDKKTPQSPTEGIADAFIQQILDGYLKKR